MERFIDRNDGRLHPRVDETIPPAVLTVQEWQALSEDGSIESLVKMSLALGVSNSARRQIGEAATTDEERRRKFLALLDDSPQTLGFSDVDINH